ncbi:hypothetical protein K3495_g4758 [Podosphaera aphanis]|nr:hypothetical protein K3495_g4758 [Podosphaera aphanis]
MRNSLAYSHEPNGIAERFNQIVVTKARIMLMDHGKFIWAEAISMAVYLYNRFPHQSINDQSPIEVLNGHPFTSTTHLRPFGSIAFVHIPEEARPAGSKLMPRTMDGILVGFTDSTNIFRIYIPSKRSVIVSRQVVLPPATQGEVSLDINTSEQMRQSCCLSTSKTDSSPASPRTKLDLEFKVKAEPPIFESQLPSSSKHLPATPSQDTSMSDGYFDSPVILTTPAVSTQPSQQIQEITPAAPRRSTRDRRQHDRYRNFKAQAVTTGPNTHKQAMAADDVERWREAVDEEMDALRRSDTWSIVPRPNDRSIVGLRWVFKVKHNADGSIERYKARVVAKGFSQIPGTEFEETYSPVFRFDSLRLLLALAAHNNWDIVQMDVKSAFLYGKLDRDIYMEIPDGFKESNMVYKLRKCIYGLKLSPLVWHLTLKTALTK